MQITLAALAGCALAFFGYWIGAWSARRRERDRLESQLRAAQRLETLGELTSGIAHDFNNIVSIILGYGEMAKENTLDGSRTRYNIDESLKAAYRAKDLLLQLLSISRGGGPDRRPISFAPLLVETLRLVRASIPGTVKVQQEVQEADHISADVSQINQLIINLCLNAGYAMRDSGGTLTVRLRKGEVTADFAGEHGISEGPCAELTFVDTGPGIPTEIQHKIFEPFFTTKPQGMGTGLGLVTVRRIVEAHKGAIVMESEPGVGTRFSVYLPLSEEGPTSEESASYVRPGKLEPACVLFVDDEEELARMGKQMLEQMGYEVVIKTNSLDTYKEFRGQPDRFNLIITDYFMPDLSGTDLAEKVRDIRPDIPLILITGFGSAITPERASQAGFKEYLLKPMAAQDLSQAITRALGEERNN